ncbi:MULTISPECIES: nuclear transport factor 2 family protein [Prauserella]|uniref:SnoaL-like domain-containing protein n=1 Tax=Prauserella endophytica TaxID=1592324 RepID=A0ABY2RZK5_9PSEU|nr:MULTISPECIES: nuclear transport factor 2 family protein [Prauserella]TKG66640.1 hypothetical protein FCN18_24560 [Prauserella endophytica]
MSEHILAKKALCTLESVDLQRGSESDFYAPYLNLLAPDISLEFGVPSGTPLRRYIHGKAAVEEFFLSGLHELFDELRVDGSVEFVGGMDKVAILGRESYRIRANGRRVEGKAFAIILEFADGLLVRDRRIREMMEFVDAHRFLLGGE